MQALPVLRLASASPRRSELLRQIGVCHVVRAARIDESIKPAELPRGYVVRMAREKAAAVWREDASLPVLGADTIVLLDARIYGKPTSQAQGVAMLRSLSGRVHEVLTAVALVSERGEFNAVSASRVGFTVLDAAQCRAYWDSGEPQDKAGGYAIQGLAAAFINSLQGSYSAVVGLPLFETAQLLAAAAVPFGRSLVT